MPSYIVYEKPGLPVEEAIETAVVVKNQHSMLAFFLPLVWIVMKRLWWVLAGYLLIAVPILALETVLPVWAGMLLTLLIGLWFAVEAPNLIGWSLERKGYVEVVSLFAEDRDHCERRYIEARLAQAGTSNPRTHSANSKPAPAARPNQILRESAPKEPVIGLFPTPDTLQEKK